METEFGNPWGNLRMANKSLNGMRLEHWASNEPGYLLPEPLKEMALDMVHWFEPAQRWGLVSVSVGLINPGRVAESIIEPAEDADDLVKSLVAQLKNHEPEPDQFIPVFHFVGERAPVTNPLFGTPKLKFNRVFARDFETRVRISNNYSADVYPDKIGAVLPLDAALNELSCPYYLVGTTVSQSSLAQPDGSKYTNGLTVMVFMKDLVDYTQLHTDSLSENARVILENRFVAPNPKR